MGLRASLNRKSFVPVGIEMLSAKPCNSLLIYPTNALHLKHSIVFA
jgi:hypothetical protein